MTKTQQMMLTDNRICTQTRELGISCAWQMYASLSWLVRNVSISNQHAHRTF